MKRSYLLIALVAALAAAAASFLTLADAPSETPEVYLARGHGLVSQGKVEEALVEFVNAVKADPASAQSRHELALFYLKLGQTEKATREFRYAVDLKADSIAPRFQLANLYLLNRDMRRVTEQLTEIQRYRPEAVEARQIAAKIALIDKDPDRAMSELAEALKNDPLRASLHTDIAAIHASKNDFNRAVASYRQALEIDPKLVSARSALLRLYLATGEQAKADQELILATRLEPENENLLHARWSEYAGARQFDEFEKLYLDLLTKKPESLIAKKRLAEFYILKGELQKGWDYSNAVQKVRPGDPDVTYFFGRLHLARKEYPRAAEVLYNASRDTPKFPLVHYYLGQAQLGNHDVGQAKRAFAKAKELNPHWFAPRLALARIYLTTNAVGAALEECASIMQATPNQVECLAIAGEARLKKGEAALAHDLLVKAKEINPRDAALAHHIGSAYLAQKKYAPALTAYEEALQLDGDRIDALAAITQVLLVQGNHKGALERVQQQLGKTKKTAEVYQLLGQLSIDQQDYETGRNHLAKALALKPDLYSAALTIAQTYMTENKLDLAIAECERFIQKNPRVAESYMLLGILHDRKQLYEQANRHYKKVLELDKNAALAANNLAWNYSQFGGNLEVALTLAQRAREVNPEDENIAHTLGWIYHKKGVTQKAIFLLKESSEKFKQGNPSVLYHLGMAYLESSDYSRARESFIKALKLDRAFPEAKQTKQALDEIGERKS